MNNAKSQNAKKCFRNIMYYHVNRAQVRRQRRSHHDLLVLVAKTAQHIAQISGRNIRKGEFKGNKNHYIHFNAPDEF